MGKVQSETGDDNGGEWWGCHWYGGSMSPSMCPSGSPPPTHIKPYIDSAAAYQPDKEKGLQSHIELLLKDINWLWLQQLATPLHSFSHCYVNNFCISK